MRGGGVGGAVEIENFTGWPEASETKQRRH